MFNERTALKMRMEQLNEREHVIIREFQAERDTIYKRLRELDKGKHALPCLRELAKQEKFTNDAYKSGEIIVPRVSAARSKNSVVKKIDQRKLAMQFLASQIGEEVKSVDIKRYVERILGEPIQNMTMFMESLMKNDPGLKKVGRGLYTYARIGE
ncbi:Rok-like winged helix domain-containing protein [Bacillus velezensis]